MSNCRGIFYQLNSIFTSKIYNDDEGEKLIETGEDLELTINFNTMTIVSVTTPFAVNKFNTLVELKNQLKSELDLLGIESIIDVFYGILRISINKESFYLVTGLELDEVIINVNNLIIEKMMPTSYEIENIIPNYTNNCGIIINKEKKITEECGFFNYTTPTVPEQKIFVYYKSENKEKPTVYYKSEKKKKKNNINFKN